MQFEFLTPPVAAEEEGGAVDLTCCRMELGDLDASGRPRPVKVEGSEFAMQCDAVMTAIVEKPDYSFLPAAFVDEKGRLKIDESSHASVGDADGGVLRRRRLRHRPGHGRRRPSTPAMRRPAPSTVPHGRGRGPAGEATDGRPRLKRRVHHRPGLRAAPACSRPAG